MTPARNNDVAAGTTPVERQLEQRIRELEGALCVIEGMAERIVSTPLIRDEIKAQVIRVLGTAPQ